GEITGEVPVDLLLEKSLEKFLNLRTKKSLRIQDGDKPKDNNVVGPSVVNMDDDVAWWVDLGVIVHVCKDRCSFKTYESLNDGSILHMENESTALVHGRGFVDLKFSYDEALDKFKVFKTEVELQQGSQIKRFRTNMGGKRGIEYIFIGYVEHYKDFRFYVNEPIDSVSIILIIELRNAIFDENRFLSVLRPNQRSLVNRTEDIGCSVVLEEVTKEVVQQPEHELRKSKRNRIPKDFGPELHL
nr:zinc finger, CCHC-type [Tanacetum cinerariifolium]